MNPRMLPFTVYPKKTTLLRSFLVCVAFVAGGCLMIRHGQKVGWLCSCFFGLISAGFLIQLHPKSAFLTVSDDGITYCSLFRTRRVQWSDISDFGVFTIRHHGISIHTKVGFNYSPRCERSLKESAVCKALTGFDGELYHTYGFSAEDLAELLSNYLQTCDSSRRQ